MGMGNEKDDVRHGEHSESIRNEQSELINTQTDTDHSPRKNDVHKNKNITQTKLDNNPWKIVLQNTQGLLTENSDQKLEMIKEYTKEEKIIAMYFTETHYTGTIKESANIEGYNIFRCDRKRKKGGREHRQVPAGLQWRGGECELAGRRGDVRGDGARGEVCGGRHQPQHDAAQPQSQPGVPPATSDQH